MQVLFESRDADGAAVRPAAIARLQSALRRLSWLVPRARVELSDVNGTRGGIDKRCRIELAIPGAKPVLITALARDWRGAVDAAVSRAARALLRSWRRRHGNERRAQSAGRLAFATQASR